MKVLLTFDVEIWCGGWDDLDRKFPPSYERYVYGRSRHGEYALPKTLEILARHRLRGVFFVEPLFSARFGAAYLERIVTLIRQAGQEVQLHLHAEWTDEITPPILDDVSRKRQHLIHYTAAEQTELIARGKALLESAGSGPLSAFRAGSYAANRDTFRALHRNGFRYDSSLNRCFAVSGPDLRAEYDLACPRDIDDVTAYPVSVFRDGLGRSRPAQVGACSVGELRDAMWSAKACGWSHFVVVSHNFEMLKPDSSRPDRIVATRFERLCRILDENRDALQACGFAELADVKPSEVRPGAPRVRLASSMQRYAEQALRRVC